MLRKSASLSDIFSMLLVEVLKLLNLKINLSGNLQCVNTFTIHSLNTFGFWFVFLSLFVCFLVFYSKISSLKY